ncbi:phosphoenolpyruvate synthase/pyruvate phosphate dikinase [Longilinea arvoryzae]|uniref:Phosphoenolpyruvate synthase/pyruvate phosphate dikinase n=1 Tax=Longilinea arvoryzae TaxID=360412 RepID=A0A0S7BDG6_9CHLR|nr:PEP/pyruvate-binding domain-containing protein [Longilinea arvoryzae]GAP12864.1 phosphoenolpyruvate synthase/pyruvate phosphate dikinase [Longilinea arvoryzae]
MAYSPTSSERLLSIYLTLGQYPILSTRIHNRMRRELFTRGIIQQHAFESEVRDMAIRTQTQEGLVNPYGEEPAEIWDMRLNRVRDQLTSLIFSQHLPFELFEQIVNEVLQERGVNLREMTLSLNPELAPIELVFEQAMTIDRMPYEQRSQFEARLQESKVVLIRSLISDSLRYINIAKQWFTIADLAEIRRRKIGAGRIGGKAAGMMLAYRILKDSSDLTLRSQIYIPESYFVGSDEMYTFMAVNNLGHWNDQKYKNEAEMRAEFPAVLAEFEAGVFSPDLLERFQSMLSTVGPVPLIVRSSSLLEDNFGTSFAGKYESLFLANQASPQENLRALTRAISHIYGSTLNPNALLYRRSKGLLDYDERMGVLIQVVQGEAFGRYYMPHGAGVAFSRNLYRWTPQIRREDGFVRLVWGLGTRAVDRVGNDYPRLIALSHPTLRPNNEPKNIRRYSQQYVDVIDLEDNDFKTLPVVDVLDGHYPPLRYLAQLDQDGYFVPLHSTVIEGGASSLVLTFDELLKRTPFAILMREVLAQLERSYRTPVDMEFTIALKELENGKPELSLTILQCRPQAHLMSMEKAILPENLPAEDVIFNTHFMVPQGMIERIDYVVYVPASGYFALPTANDRALLARAVGSLNAALDGKNFICVGPGRWGSTNTDLGVPIDYGDIYHTRALVELAGQGIGLPPEPSLGTHFFQDILEAQIYPLAIHLDDPQNSINTAFFEETPNHLDEVLQLREDLRGALRLIRVGDYRPGHTLRIVMDEDKGQAVGYLVKAE